MVVATADAAGRPSARNVLLRDLDDRGFVFFTNYESRKGKDLSVNPAVSLLFSWVPIGRQVVVLGRADRGAARRRATPTSPLDPVPARFRPGRRTNHARSPTGPCWRNATGPTTPSSPARDVPRPPHWGGIRVVPESLELWQGRPDRLHDRLRYERDAGAGGWRIVRLCP